MGRSEPSSHEFPGAPPAAVVDDRQLLETFLQTTPDHVYFKDLDSRFTRISLALARWMGLTSADEAVGRSDADFFAREHAARARRDEERIMRTGEPSIGIEEREVWPDGTVTWVSTTKVPLIGQHGEVIGIFGLSRDITERRLAAEQVVQQSEQLAALAAELEMLSISDELTGLHNRRGLRLLGGDRVDAARRTGAQLCVMFLDLDGLKAINDALGHGAGDQALVEVADALRRSVRSDDIVGRVGGDEFAMVLAGTSRAEAECLREVCTFLPHNPTKGGPPPRSR
jgi:PAS domain S-box-containing protein